MKIVYYVPDISFSVHEGIRKQGWWMAREMRALSHDVSIVTDGFRKKTSERDGVRILPGHSLARIAAAVLHYLSHPTPRFLPLLLRSQARRQLMTIFDGALTGFWKRPWHRLVARTMNERIFCLTV